VTSVAISDDEQTLKKFTVSEFRRILQASNLVATVAFWRGIEPLAPPELKLRAMGILREFAVLAYEDCRGWAFSPQQAECFEYCGLTPWGVRSPGSTGVIT
jgi:hypothetical protein